MHAVLLFALGLFLDLVWTFLVQAVHKKRAWTAGAAQTLFTAVVTGSTWFIVEDRTVLGLLAYSIGGGLGTALPLLRRAPRQARFHPPEDRSD